MHRDASRPPRADAAAPTAVSGEGALSQLERLAQQQRSILNTVKAGICHLRDRKLVWVNPSFAEMFGYAEREIIGESTARFYATPDDFDRIGREGYRQLATGEVYSTEARMRRKDGTLLWCTITGQAIVSGDPGEGSIWTLMDTTTRREAEELLRRERAFTDAVLESVPGLLYVYDDEGRLVRWNRQHESLTGYSADELREKRLLDWYRNDPEDRARIVAAVQRLPIDGQAQAEANLETKSGQRIRFFFTAVQLRLDERNYFVGVGLDVTDRVRAEQALRESRERLELALLGADLGSWDWNIETGAATFDTGWTQMMGYAPHEVAQHVTAWERMVHPDDIAEVRRALDAHLRGETPFYQTEHRLRHKSGDWVWVLARGRVVARDKSGRPLRAAGTHLNITDRRRARELREQLQQAMKMEAVGRLAGGIAHDFNNLLTTIAGNVELARLDLAPNDPLAHNLDEVHDAVERAAALTRQLLAFSRRQIIEPKVLNLNELVDNLHKMLGRVIGEDIALTTVLAPDLGAVKVDPGQFEQVLVNLAVNARDAMPDGGKLHVETANVDLDAEYCATHPGVEPGPYVRLAVSDTGHGMSDEVKQRIFEPFFTTKPLGRGTGLGLATIFGTVKQAGGAVEVYSEVGLGTTFKIYLPRLSESPEPLTAERTGARLAGGTETILVVEDEPSVRALALLLLRRLGYHVLHAGSGDEALALAGGYTERIDLLITDVVMPGMNGRELAQRLRQVHPETAVLFTSGYTENIIVHHGVIEDSLDFIGKPYTLHGLATKVREVLGAR